MTEENEIIETVEEVPAVDEKEEKKKKVKAEIIDWIKTLLIYCVLPIVVFEIFFTSSDVPTGSMEPTIPAGAKVIVSRYWYDKEIDRGDIVVFQSDELRKLLIKRCIGLPGDVIEFVGGDLYINGEYTEEEYVSTYDDYYGYFEVPEGCYFFCGDNRAYSADARYWFNPYISADKIFGKARLTVFPLSNFGTLN